MAEYGWWQDANENVTSSFRERERESTPSILPWNSRLSMVVDGIAAYVFQYELVGGWTIGRKNLNNQQKQPELMAPTQELLVWDALVGKFIWEALYLHVGSDQ